MDTAVEVTLALFVLGLAFQAGRLSIRVDHLESRVDRVESRWDMLTGALNELKALIRGEGV